MSFLPFVEFLFERRPLSDHVPDPVDEHVVSRKVVVVLAVFGDLNKRSWNHLNHQRIFNYLGDVDVKLVDANSSWKNDVGLVSNPHHATSWFSKSKSLNCWQKKPVEIFFDLLKKIHMYPVRILLFNPLRQDLERGVLRRLERVGRSRVGSHDDGKLVPLDQVVKAVDWLRPNGQSHERPEVRRVRCSHDETEEHPGRHEDPPVPHFRPESNV